MAGSRQPGPTYVYNAPASVADGTSPLTASPTPGPTSLNHERLVSRAAHLVQSIYDFDMRIMVGSVLIVANATREIREGADCIYQAYLEALILAPQAIVDETGFDLSQALKSFLPELLEMLAELGAGVFFGAVVGGAVGFVFGGGAGAAPGIVLGGELGLDIGVALLSWFGLGYLASSVVLGFAELTQVLRHSLELAWSAKNLRGVSRAYVIKQAGHELARAAGILMRLILLGIIAYLTKKAAIDSTKRAASLAEMVNRDGAGVVSEVRVTALVEKLRASRFGRDLGNWVEQNWRLLVGPQSLRDISTRFRFSEWASGEYFYKKASGELGVPGEVLTHRDEAAQKMSAGTGEHAGHMIGIQFGPPGDIRNLGLQNANVNTYAPKGLQEAFTGSAGNYLKLEREFARLLKLGFKVEVDVTDKYRANDKSRYFTRKVEWETTSSDGDVRKGSEDYGNFDSPQRRQANSNEQQ